ncbi:GntR family transcriptional regulator [Streptosporangium saharense]|uniref:DNA-binding GntR family transcriptional regulator n=1 Tax=Streptosporangium saharense TaxID=1706840 RepID=A0A7W7QNT2_9ACTN|nr:winged helix-turn-helix domain-containing protein [Streptosporangium saharense]MBB4917016.1 DNA-binding GntR family transcriptional regulator [Streptosporangium saharense]
MWEREPNRPVWEQVTEILRDRITSGIYRPKQPIPSLPHLMEEFGIALNTARKAVHALVAEGRVETVRGMGTFVVAPGEKNQE